MATWIVPTYKPTKNLLKIFYATILCKLTLSTTCSLARKPVQKQRHLYYYSVVEVNRPHTLNYSPIEYQF